MNDEKTLVQVCKECGRVWEFSPHRNECPRCLKKNSSREAMMEIQPEDMQDKLSDAFATFNRMLAGGFRNQLKCPHCGHIFDFDYLKDTWQYECPKCHKKWGR